MGLINQPIIRGHHSVVFPEYRCFMARLVCPTVLQYHTSFRWLWRFFMLFEMSLSTGNALYTIFCQVLCRERQPSYDNCVYIYIYIIYVYSFCMCDLVFIYLCWYIYSTIKQHHRLVWLSMQAFSGMVYWWPWNASLVSNFHAAPRKRVFVGISF